MYKLFVTDMDGTFLNKQSDYDRDRFQALFAKMQEKDLHFGAASGNQYAQIAYYFPEIIDHIHIVAENGAYGQSKGEPIFSFGIEPQMMKTIVAELDNFKQISKIVCGLNTAYVLNSFVNRREDNILNYFKETVFVDEFDFDNGDTYFKLACDCPDEETQELTDQLNVLFNPMGITAVTPGFGGIDIIKTGVHKWNGLQILANHLGVKENEIVTFGDAANDLEMLRHAGLGVAMANGTEEVKKVANTIALSHDESGVIDWIEKFIDTLD